MYSFTLPLYTLKFKLCGFNFVLLQLHFVFFFPTLKKKTGPTFLPIFGKMHENIVPIGKKKTKPLSYNPYCRPPSMLV